MRLHGMDYDRTGLARMAGDLPAAGGVRSVVLDDGAERGIRVLEFRTGGGLSFDVLVDRAMDIGAAEYRGVGFGWRSATGFRHPGLHEYRDEDGLSWLRSFCGLTVTAGLDHTLFTADVDSSNYRYPYRPTVWNGLHGRVANIPARLHGYGERWDGDRCVLWAEGEIRQAAIFAEHLRLTRRIEADLGGREIRLTDTVRNAGFDVTPHMYLYHINVGWPLLEAGAGSRRRSSGPCGPATAWPSRAPRTCSSGRRSPASWSRCMSTSSPPVRTGWSARPWSTTGSAWPSSWSTTSASSRRSSSGCTCARARTRWVSSRAAMR